MLGGNQPTHTSSPESPAAQTFVFEAPTPSYCADPAGYKLPVSQPAPDGVRPLFYPFLNATAGGDAASFCPANGAAPPYSLYRRGEFGSGVLEVLNATDARWSWFSPVKDGAPRAVDVAAISKTPECANQNRGLAPADLAALRARWAASGAGPAPAPAPPAQPSSTAAPRRGAGAGALIVLAALALAAV
jgi:hypothetical protein